MSEMNLIFLISQPRSGSTLLQKMIGAHSSIYTRSEPWISLNFLYNLNKNNLNEIVYDKQLESVATNDFILNLTNSRETYIQEIRNMLLNLYGDYLKQFKKSYFLDKTPRYYFILDQLKEVFPHSKKILLIRNPLDVLNSLIPRKKTLYMLSENKFDLIYALNIIIEELKQKDPNLYIMRYEDLVNNTQNELQKLCDYLNISFEEKMVSDFLNNNEKWVFGDQKIYGKSSIDNSSINQWKKELENPQYWRLFYDYLLLINKERFEILGYNYNETLNMLLELNPFNSVEEALANTRELGLYLEKDRDSLIGIYAKNQELEQKQNIINIKNQEINQKNQEINQVKTENNKLKVALRENDYKLNLLMDTLESIVNTSTKTHPIQKIKEYKNLINLYHQLKGNQ